MFEVKNQARKCLATRILKYKTMADPGAIPLVLTKLILFPWLIRVTGKIKDCPPCQKGSVHLTTGYPGSAYASLWTYLQR